MKRGRPNLRNSIKPLIVETISSSRVPKSVNSLKKDLELNLKKEISWNTVKKYLDELVKTDIIQPITLSHSKHEKKEGLTVYTLKR